MMLIRPKILCWLFAAASCLPTALAFPETFSPEEPIASDSRNYEMSRNPNHSMVVDSSGAVHLVFWDGALETSPQHPSTVWYCRRNPGGIWSSPEIVDNSYTSTGTRVGGRHPSLVVRPDGEVQVFWHDYRHCSAAKRWIDNIEIYTDVRPATGSFSTTDTRLTNTFATHDGDNGYAPQAVLVRSGEIYVVWYDYHSDRNLADIFLMKSDTQGEFDPSAPFESYRLTNISQRANGISYTLPDLAIDSSGTLHLVWTRDNLGGYGVYYAPLKSGEALTTPTCLSTTGADFLDPPHITSSPRGDVYAIWTEHSGTAGSNVVIARLRPGSATFESPFQVAPGFSQQKHGDLKVDPDGLLHIVWVDGRTGRDQIHYGKVDPDLQTLILESKVSAGTSDARRPCLALDAKNRAYIAWMDYRNGQGSIYFRTTARPANVKSSWTLYR